MLCVLSNHSYELELKLIGRYLKATHSRGFILNPSSNLKIDCYPNADFSGMYIHKKTNNLACVKSRTGYVIMVANHPILWQSKLQSETALSTMEAEVIALAHSCRELLPNMDMIAFLGEAVGLPEDLTTMHVSSHEDNAESIDFGTDITTSGYTLKYA